MSLAVDHDRATARLLLGGALLAPFFYALVLAQLATRDGFDITRHAISSLSLGDAGWIQRTNFLVTGVLALLLAAGLRRVLRGGPGGRWAPALVAAYGVGILVAGIYPPDPALGFPPGAPETLPATMSRSAQLHSIGFFLAFTALTAACWVVAGRSHRDGDRAWGRFSAASGTLAPLLVVLGSTVLIGSAGICFALAGVVGFGWLSATAAHLRPRVV